MIEERTLIKLNLLIAPPALLAAAFCADFLDGLAVSMTAGFVVGLVLAVRFVAKVRKSRRGGPRTTLSAQASRFGPSVQAGFVFIKSMTGVLIGSAWYAAAFGLTRAFR